MKLRSLHLPISMPIWGFVVFLLWGIFFHTPVYAETCTFRASGSTLSITNAASCQFAGNQDGIDVASGNANTANLRVPLGKSLTVRSPDLSSQKIAVGSLTVEDGATVFIPDGSSIVVGAPIWLKDADNDGYPANGDGVVSFTKPAGYNIRRSDLSSLVVDCDDTNPAVTTECPVTDANLSLGSHNRTTNTSAPAVPAIQDYYQETGKDNGLVALWHMNETENDSCSGGQDACDASGNANHGIATGTTIVDGKIGKGRDFNGNSDYITVDSDWNDNVIEGTGDFTISFWLNNAEWVNYKSIFGTMSSATYGIGWGINFGSGYNGSINFAADSNNDGAWDIVVGFPTYSPVNEWHHYALTRTSMNTFQWYMDGRPMANSTWNTITANYSIKDNNRSLTIGAGQRYATGAYEYFFHGSFDELAIWKRALSPEEIKLQASRRPYGTYTSSVLDIGTAQTNMNLSWTWAGVGTRTYSTGTLIASGGETPYSSTGLVAQWNFNATSGTTATNDAGAGTCGGTASNCDGTLTSFASTTSQDQAAGTGWTNNDKRWGAGALMFDGVDDYVVVSNNASQDFSSSAFTIEGWINFRTNPSVNYALVGRTSLAASTGYSTWIDNQTGGSKLAFYANGIGTLIYGKSVLTPGQWYHFSFVREGTGVNQFKIYLNGVLDATSTLGVFSNYNGNMWIGRAGPNWNNTYYLNGILDSVRLYSRALTPSEILSNYNAGTIEMQWRAGSTTTPDSSDYAAGTNWTQWAPVGTAGYESQLDAMDSSQASWYWDMNSAGNADGTTAASMPKTKSQDTTYKLEGTGSMKTVVGQPQVDANTIGLWHMEETGGTGAYIKDSSVNANHGTPNGTTVGDGFLGKARSFNGISDFISVPDSTVWNFGTGPFTIDYWINFTTYPIYVATVGKFLSGTPNKYSFQLNNGSTEFRLYLSTNGTAWDTSPQWTGITLPTKTWHHIAFTRNGASCDLYINGVSQGAKACASGSIYDSDVPLLIGKHADDGSFLNGSMDEFRISSIAMTADQIAETYRAGRDHRLSRSIASADMTSKTKFPFWVASDRLGTFSELTIGESAFANYEPDANTVGLWHLEEQTGTGAYLKDSSASENNGTPTGTTFVQGKIGKGRNFDGNNDWINMGSPASLDFGNNGPFTFSGWFKPTLLDYEALLSKTVTGRTGAVYTYYTSFMANGQLQAYSPAVGTNKLFCPAGSVVSGVWQHVAFVYDGTNIIGYVNGVKCGSTAFSYTDIAAHDVTIGSFWTTTTYDYNGAMDELRLDNVARTPSEIRQAYEIGLRTHPITIDFKANIFNSGLMGDNLLANASDLWFYIDETAYGSTAKANHLFTGDKVIVKENVNGTEYMAQGTVDTVVPSTGNISVLSWDAGSTFPASGYTVNATVFKWQREWMDLTGIPTGTGTGDAINAKDAITRLTLRLTDTSQGANIWLDDFRAGGPYLNTSPQSVTLSSAKQYFQVRTIFSASDIATSSALNTMRITPFKPSLTPTPTRSACVASGQSCSAQSDCCSFRCCNNQCSAVPCVSPAQ